MVQRTHFGDKTSFLVPTFAFFWSATPTKIKSYAATRNCVAFVLVSLNALWKNLPERTGSNARLGISGRSNATFLHTS